MATICALSLAASSPPDAGSTCWGGRKPDSAGPVPYAQSDGRLLRSFPVGIDRPLPVVGVEDPVRRRWSPVQPNSCCRRRLQPCWGDRVPRHGGETRGIDVHRPGSADPDVGEVVNVVPLEGPALPGDKGPDLPTVPF